MTNFSLSDKILKVSEFNELFDKLVSYQNVIIEGEISELSVSQNKWLFLTIKDTNSQIEIFAVAFNISTLSLLKEGMLVHVYGTPHIHQKSGRFRITAQQIIPAGEGELRIAFEILKQKLEKEGLFAPERKRPIPKFPISIALLTAEESEAYHDFVKILGERTGGVKIYHFPVLVQGADSINSIVNAFKLINSKFDYLDLAVLTRGGGSLEDLQAFNSEGVVRAVFSSKIPVVSAVGHEKDITLCDLVSDLRASTPSNAAELIARDKREIVENLNFLEKHLESLSYQRLHSLEKEVSDSFAVIESNSKDIFYRFEGQKTKMQTLVDYNLNDIKNRLNNLKKMEQILNSLSYKNTLKRGFSITLHDNKILRNVNLLSKGDMIKTKLYKGNALSIVENKYDR